MSERVKVDVWSDIACPWCYIGKRRFEEGARRAGVETELEYHSFELSPDTPEDFAGTSAEYLAQHKGMALPQAEQMLAQVTAIAAEVGLHYDFDAVHHTKTLLAHELLHEAKRQGRQLEVAEVLFSAYFEQGEHVGELDTLVRIGERAGLDAHATRAALDAHEHLGAVHADIAQATAFGIRGVPFFVLDGRYGVSGAQDPEVFAQALQQVAAESVPARVQA